MPFHKDFVPTSNEKLSENGLMASKTMNTHLHVLEAYTELYRLEGNEEVRKCLVDTLTKDLSAAVENVGIVRTRDLIHFERLNNLKTLNSLQQRNVVLHPEFIDGKYDFYTRPMDTIRSPSFCRLCEATM